MKPMLKRDIPPRAFLAIVSLALLVSLLAGGEVSRSQPPAEAKSHAAPAPERAAPPAEPARAAAASEPAREADLPRPRYTHAPSPVADLFAPQALEKPAAEAKAEAARAPAVPPLPFTYLGRIIEDERTTVFVGRDEDSYALVAGETIARLYRVERIGPDAVVFVHLPTGSRQTLTLRAPG